MASKPPRKQASAAAKKPRAGKPRQADAPIVMQVSASEGQSSAHTVIYVHGIGNKPEEPVLCCMWDNALFDQRMGDRTRMAYWVNRRRHGPPSAGQCDDSDSSVPEQELRSYALLLAREDADPEILIDELAGSSAVQDDFLHQVLGALEQQQDSTPGGPGVRSLWGGLSWVFTRAFLRDVHDFFFDADERERMRRALLDVLEPGGGPFVVVAHSQGSMIAYDVLRELDPARFPVSLFVTIGSPLGLAPVRDRFKKWTKQKKLAVPACAARWINVANRGDIVCADTDLGNDVARSSKFENIVVDSPNDELRRDKHAATGYLSLAEVRIPVHHSVGSSFLQLVSHQVIGSDLVERIERAPRSQRHPVLIQLTTPKKDVPRDIEKIRSSLDLRIRELAADDPQASDTELSIEHLRYWLAARLRRSEIERLRTEFAELDIQRIWRNAEKRALINRSSAFVQARPANAAYAAAGAEVRWAVLDTGIRADHPHFAEHANVEAVWDCTGSGAAKALALTGNTTQLDPHGHGTHVAGIIAGAYRFEDDEDGLYAGMAPRARLLGFKVLQADGRGQDSWIIKALDKIADINERAGRLAIHGVNLSLGGYFDPSVYACGHTPLCTELRRLWRQGVLVVIAAGNEGFAELRTSGGSAWPSNMDLSIGDPANLDDGIAVGSIHRTNPHTYGVSYFSSRGPTADGRQKPDLVAPGEKILSARHDWRKARKPKVEDLYVPMSGTSMAAPHVAGVLASFLSARPEFIGEPERVKRILLDACTDLQRDRYAQGAGMPNLIRMLAGT